MGVADLIGAGPRVVVVTGARAEEEVAPVVPVAVAASVDAGLATVVADVYVAAPEAPGRGATLIESLDEALRDAIVIVDDADLEPGRVASVLALDAARRRRGRPALRLRRGGRRRAARLDATVTTAPDGAATSLSRSAAGMGAAAAVSRAFGGVRMVVIAAVLGTTYLGNAFQASNSVSNVLFELLAAGALSAVLVPTFVERFGRGDQRRAEEVAGGLLSLAWVGLGVVTVVGIAAAPWIAELLTSGVDDPIDRRRAAGAHHVPAALLHPAGAALRARRGRHRRAARPGPVRPHGGRADRQHRGAGDRHARVPADGRTRSRPRPRRAASSWCSRSGARSAWPPSSRSRPSGCGGPGSACGSAPGAPGATPRCARCSASRAGRPCSTPAPGSCWRAALIAGGGVAGGVVAYQLAMVVFLAPYGIVAQPIHTAVLPRLAAEAQRGDARACARRCGGRPTPWSWRRCRSRPSSPRCRRR